MAVVREDQDLTGLKDTVSLSHLFTGSSVQYSVELVRNITAASASSFSLLTTLPRRHFSVLGRLLLVPRLDRQSLEWLSCR